MTGFIRGLFSKSKSTDEATKPASVEPPKQEKVERPKKEKAARPPKENSAFFLDATDAQTYGNLEYMKASKKTRRTFPKTVDNPEAREYIQELSAMGRVVPGQAKVEIVAPKSESESTTPIENAAAQRRKASSDMDMFRKMAKDIRK
ncbi:hypothetical protein LEP3755_27410 [Leptolyngbya sp. NIES-3755]|nr:hypothetical protein LEP3755_27410 [Leptolyngbya sp. NIES-3755]